MDPYLISLTVLTRVAHEPNAVVKALETAVNVKGSLVLLGTKGSMRKLQGHQVNLFGSPERYMQYAEHGLLYLELDGPPRYAFAAELDGQTGLPLLMECYNDAFARRSYAGAAKPADNTLR